MRIPSGPYIASDMGPGTGSHIASDMRPEGRITLGISDRGAPNGWGPISLLHRFDQVHMKQLKYKLVKRL